MIEYVCRYWMESDWDDWTNQYIPAGFREEVIVTAATRGQAKSTFLRDYLWLEGYDAQWIDRFSIRKVQA